MSINDPNYTEAGLSRNPVAQVAWANLTTDSEYEKQAEAMQQAINEDPEIEDPSNLAVFIKKESGVPTIFVIGKAASKLDRRRVLEIANEHRREDQVVRDEVETE